MKILKSVATQICILSSAANDDDGRETHKLIIFLCDTINECNDAFDVRPPSHAVWDVCTVYGLFRQALELDAFHDDDDNDDDA